MYIDFAFRAGADTDAVIGQIIESEAGFDAVDVDEHIRYLGGDDGGIALTLGAAGHGDAVADLGTGQDEGPVLDGIEVRAEQFADDIRIRSAAAQIRRGVESAHAGLDGEVLGVDDDAGIEGRRFDLRQFYIFLEILQELRHQFARRRTRRFRIGQQGLLDEVRTAAVMVDDDAPVRFVQQSRGYGHVRAVRIDDEQQGLAVADVLRRFCRNEQVLEIGIIHDLIFQAPDGVGLIADDDMYRLACQAGHVGYADGSADAVIVFPFMSHDQDHIARINEFVDGLGDDAGPDAGILFDAARLAAVEVRRSVLFIDDDLVAAAAQSQVEAGPGFRSQFVEIGFARRNDVAREEGDAHAERHGDAVDRMDGTDFFQERKVIFLIIFQRIPAHAGNVLLIAVSPDKAIMAGQLADKAVVDVGHQRSPLDSRHPLGNFLQVVDLDIAENGDSSQGIQLLPFRIGNVFKIEDEVIVIVSGFGLQILVDDAVIAFADVFKEISRFPPELIDFQVRHDVVQLLVVVDVADPVSEDAVGPAQVGLHVDDGNADRQILHGIRRSLVDALGDGIEELADFPVAFVMVLAGQDISPADEDQGQQGDDPIIYGNDDKQQDGNQEERFFRPP